MSRESNNRRPWVRRHMDSDAEQRKTAKPFASHFWLSPGRALLKKRTTPFYSLPLATLLLHQLLTQELCVPRRLQLPETSLSQHQQEAGVSNTPIIHPRGTIRASHCVIVEICTLTLYWMSKASIMGIFDKQNQNNQMNWYTVFTLVIEKEPFTETKL